MVEYSIEDFFRWLQTIKKEFEDFEDNGDWCMSEKRFSIFDDDEVKDVWNELKGTIYCYDEEEAQRCENWLNNLHNQNQKLKEENEQLQKELDNFKPVIFQDMRKGTAVILYSKGD